MAAVRGVRRQRRILGKEEEEGMWDSTRVGLVLKAGLKCVGCKGLDIGLGPDSTGQRTG